jgi:ABC-type glycerol-3-phosphate transport system permease component
MNWLQLLLLTLAAIFVGLLWKDKRQAFSYGRFVVLLFVAAIMLLPFVWLICAAFKDPSILMAFTFLPPIHDISHRTINLSNFRTLFTPSDTPQGLVSFWRYVVNSLFLASTATFLSLIFSSMGGYAMAKYKFAGRNFILAFMVGSTAIPAVVLLAPNFEIIWRLGWMDTYKALLIPTCVSVFGVFLFRQAMLSVPNELIEAGRIDGCGEFKIYLVLVMPLVRPMTGAFCLISFLGAWNSFIPPNIYLQSQRNLTLPVVLNQYIGIYTQQYGVFLAGTLLALIPPAILFLALQKEFIRGLTSGAVKQ